jgi:hypothetical protein
MKRFLILLAVMVLFIACDYAKESVEMYPDIEITYMYPLGYYTCPADTNISAEIEEIKFVAENSIDCYLKELIWEYIDSNDNTFFTSEPLAMYAKIEGKVDTGGVDTTILKNVYLPLDTVRTYLVKESLHSAKALLHFIAVDEYYGTRYDTCDAWFGIYMQ